MLSATRYSIKNVRLKPWVKFIWYFETKSNILLNNKLLPTDSIDIILNLSDVMEYKIENQDYTANNSVMGISFHPFGLYPFLKIPISEFNRQIVDLELKFHSIQSGFIDTELLYDEKSQKWIMIQHWESIEDLKSASGKMFKDSSTEKFRKALKTQTVKMNIIPQIKSWKL